MSGTSDDNGDGFDGSCKEAATSRKHPCGGSRSGDGDGDDENAPRRDARNSRGTNEDAPGAFAEMLRRRDKEYCINQLSSSVNKASGDSWVANSEEGSACTELDYKLKLDTFDSLILLREFFSQFSFNRVRIIGPTRRKA